MTNCLFCKIVNKEIPADVIFENDMALGILDVHPKAPGHTMVIPKTHAETILDLPDDFLHSVASAIKEVTLLLKTKLSPDGFTIGINHGRHAGQAIEHLHIHIIPRFQGDGGTSIHGVVNNPPEDPEKIKKLLTIDH